jgi:hypothetical protein
MKNIEAINWVENWLDSASERGYQPAFIAALVREGYTIVHNTSHNSLELGKDVVAKSPDGKWFAFQLKGNPIGRFTMSQWHKHFDQLRQLCHLPILDIIGSRIVEKFTPVLVTNGEVEEDVQHALTLFNRGRSNRSKEAGPLRIWNRGTLLRLFDKASESIWPQEPHIQIELLKGVVRDYRAEADMEQFQSLVNYLLEFDAPKLSKDKSFSNMLLGYIAVNIYTSNYADNMNFYESIKLKSYYIVNCLSEANKRGLKSRRYLEALRLMRAALFSELLFFVESLCKRYENAPLINDNYLAEFPIYGVRRLLIQALCAVTLIEYEGDVVDSVRLRALERIDYKCFTHEAVVPAFLSVFWAKDLFEARRTNEMELYSLLKTIVAMANTRMLHGPYHEYADVVSQQHKDFLHIQFHDLDFESAKNYSYFAKPIFYLIARRNWKLLSKIIWPDLTMISHATFVWEKPEYFCQFRTEKGVNRNVFFGYPQTWQGLVENIPDKPEVPIPHSIEEDLSLLLLFLIFFPFRANPELLVSIDGRLTDSWY